MFNSDSITKEDIKEHYPHWSQIPDQPYRILIVGVFASRIANPALNLICHQVDIDRINLYAKDLY